jgi:hypothetical protein
MKDQARNDVMSVHQKPFSALRTLCAWKLPATTCHGWRKIDVNLNEGMNAPNQRYFASNVYCYSLPSSFVNLYDMYAATQFAISTCVIQHSESGRISEWKFQQTTFKPKNFNYCWLITFIEMSLDHHPKSQ